MRSEEPQFRARILFTFEDNRPERKKWFLFPEDRRRRVPMSMDGVGGLHTVNMWSDREGKFTKDDEVNVNCTIIWTEGFRDVVRPGVKFRLWDGGYFADGIVTERCDAGWHRSSESV